MNVKRWASSKTATRHLLFAALAVVIGVTISLALPADYTIGNSVLGNGGGRISNGDYLLVGTVGQPAIGAVSDSKHWLFSGAGHDFQGILWTDVIEVEQVSNLPSQYRLEQNYPNPFNPTTTIRFAVPGHSRVELKLYNILGETVATLVDRELPAGEYEVTLDARGLASGIYLYQMRAETHVQTRKLVVLK